MTRTGCGFVAVVAAILVAASMGTVARGQQDVFRVATDAVRLSVTVTDADDHLVGGLEQTDFQVLEDGLPQEIQFFSRAPQPIALSILIDASSSMDKKLEVAQEAAIGFVSRLGPNDLAQIIPFGSHVDITQPFTNDKAKLSAAIKKIEGGGSTSLYLSLYIALNELMRSPPTADSQVRRQAIVVLSDGQDTSSPIDYTQVMDQSKRASVAVYAIGLRSKEENTSHEFREADWVLRTLSRETGGRVFFVTDAGQLPAVYRQISDELANQYTMGYRSSNVKRDGAWRQLSVRVVGRSATARTKMGYFGPKAGS